MEFNHVQRLADDEAAAKAHPMSVRTRDDGGRTEFSRADKDVIDLLAVGIREAKARDRALVKHALELFLDAELETAAIDGMLKPDHRSDDRGHECRVNVVARVMREAGIAAKTKRKFRQTTDSNHSHPVAENVLDRDFDPEEWSSPRTVDRWKAV